MADHRVAVSVVEKPVVLQCQENKVVLQIDNRPVVVQMSGKGPAGVPGASIRSIEKTGSEGLTDIYTLTMTNGAEYSFRVMNGEKGDPGIVAAFVDDSEELLTITPDVENYEGEYAVTPATEAQRLETSGLMMQQDVNVAEIPYSEVSNEHGGYTATIGG